MNWQPIKKAHLDELLEDKKRLDWLETQDCWIAVSGEYEASSKWAAGGGYSMSIREVCDKARKEVADE